MKLLKAMFALFSLSYALSGFALTDDEYMEFTGALTENKPAIVKKFVEADPKLINQKFFGWEPLQMAATHGNLKIVQYLVEKGADQNYVHPIEKTTAFQLAAYGGYEDVVKYLATHGTDINKKMKGDMSVAVFIRNEGNNKMADLLVSLGVKEDGCKDQCF